MTIEADLIRHYGEVRRRLIGEPEVTPASIAARPVWRIVFAKADRRPGWRGIADEVCRKHKVTFDALIGPERQKLLSFARWEAWWRMRHEIMVDNQPMSYPEIGRRFDRDHTTILYGVRQYEVARRR